MVSCAFRDKSSAYLTEWFFRRVVIRSVTSGNGSFCFFDVDLPRVQELLIILETSQWLWEILSILSLDVISNNSRINSSVCPSPNRLSSNSLSNE